MNIAILSMYSGCVERGVEVWVRELTKRLSQDHTVNIYQAGPKKEPYEITIPIQIDWDQTDYTTHITRKLYLDYWSRKIFSFTKKALRKINKNPVDIIIPTNGGWQSILTKMYAKQYRKKMMIVGHSGIGWDDYINLLTRPDVFIALTHFQKKWAVNNIKNVNSIVIPDGVDTEKFSQKTNKAKVSLKPPIILAVSSLSPYKRVDLAIQAVSKLHHGSLIVLGKGDKRQTESIEKLGKSLLGNRFLLTSVSHDEIVKWYNASDIFTFPSYANESFGMVILEAMACNKPVVVNNDPIRAEIVGEGGILCNPLDISGYTLALDKALKKNFDSKPRNQAVKFDWSKIVAQYNKLFETI